ncbi:hypothetical protein CQW23_20168 [Capsicum baccatum]|uniref:Receptor-like protein 12 n=1 Tax=Capsicum baccatum TaxID=33114 RepID=A0A2G2W7W8_CAPBA|nr:hypothetical protein CQW23_20168 [Capsicum baccatum]
MTSITSLSHLNLSYNNLHGPSPSTNQFGTFTDPADFEAIFHKITFAKLHQLKLLAISCERSFAINLSDEWVPPFSLTFIELRRCFLGPKFPAWLETQKQLEIVILANDTISDPIPPWLWTMCSQLQVLDLSDNQIDGDLPSLVSFPSYPISQVVESFHFSYQNNVLVDLSSNRFHGLLPLWPNVTHLNLANNLFSGSIPLDFGHVMTKIQVLDLAGNAFTGSLPNSITKAKQLLRVDLSDNHLSGNIPDWWYDLQQLQVIDLYGNDLSGSIPPSICSPPSLFWLRLSPNNLSGELPRSFRNCNGLLALDIGDNKQNQRHHTRVVWRKSLYLCKWFYSFLLRKLERSKVREILQVESQLLLFQLCFYIQLELVEKGTKKKYTFTLDQVNLIDLSSNNLHGEIPKEITNLSALGTLNLSWNQLSGRIPEDIGSMQKLETLDLSSNHLSGSIPLSMTSITSLSYLNLSHNNLHGPIPSTNQFGTFTDPSCFRGNPGLCGKQLMTDCSPAKRKETERKLKMMMVSMK